MSNLRWIERDGRAVLQQRSPVDFEGTSAPFTMKEKWSDVPTHKEPTKSRRQEKIEQLAKELYGVCFRLEDWDYASAPIKQRMREYAEAALEWVEKQLPVAKLPGGFTQQYYLALSDVRKNLGLD